MAKPANGAADDEARVRALRVANAKLMEGNLALVMAIRETDTKIQQEWTKLHAQCRELEARGGKAALPASCAALLQEAGEDAEMTEKERQQGRDVVDGVKQETKEASSCEETAKEEMQVAKENGLSVRSVLNDEPIDEEEDASSKMEEEHETENASIQS